MKLTVFILIAAIMQVSAASIAQKVTLMKKEVALSEVFQEIRKQTAYNVLWEPGKLKGLDKVNAQFKNSSIEEVMNFCLSNTHLSYTIKDKTIVIKEKDNSFLNTMVSYLASIDVRGIVVDEAGNPLIGATIRIKNINKAIITNTNGEFHLINVDKEATLVISYIGYETKEIKVPTEPIVIKLIQNKSKLDEVVVQAYGTTTRRLNTGNIGKISTQEISNQPVGNPLAALDGRIAGMVVTQSSGLPGSMFKVEVRGRTSIDRSLSDDQPLFVVDGIPIAANNSALNKQTSALGNPNSLTNVGGISPINGINPRDIESIEVLKDADATAIYGSRGANGVILITTKKGKKGKTRIDVNTYTGFNRVTSTISTYNTQQYVAMRKAAFKTDNAIPTISNAYDILAWDTTRYTNFNKLLARNISYTSDADLSLSGGNDNTQFLISGNYHRESTVLQGNLADKRGSMHFNINHASENKKLKVSLSGSYSSDANDLVSQDFTVDFMLPPNLRLYDDNGNLAWNEGGVNAQGYLSNPLSYFKQTYKTITNNLNSNLQIAYNFMPELTVRANMGYNNIQLDETKLLPKTAYNPLQIASNASTFNSNRYSSYIIEPQIEYNKEFNKLKVAVLVGGSLQATDNTAISTNASGYSNESLMNSLVGATSITGTRSISPYRYEALFGRLNLNWINKYLFNVTVRRDGSSRFGPDKQFASFGSVGTGWIFSNEDFLKDKLSWFSFGKLRGSYGITGNDKITNYQYLDTWTSTPNTYSGLAGFYPTKLFNPDYHWEKTKKIEGGLELGFLKDNILFTASYYNNRTSNQLVQYKLPSLTGFSSVVANLPALLENSGWELTLTTNNIKSKDFSWSTSFNITIPKNRLLSFPDLQYSSYNSTFVLGESLNLIYKYKYLGVNSQTGMSTFEDKNGDGKLDVNDNQLAGNTDPKFYGGLQNSLRFKNFQLDFFFSFRKQTGVTFLRSINLPGQMYNLPTILTDFWTKPGDVSQHQRLIATNSTAAAAWSDLVNRSNAPYGDASFIRLKNLSFSYNLPVEWISKIHVSNARIYLQGQNLLTITNYKLGDPEIQSLSTTPSLRVIVVGVNFTL